MVAESTYSRHNSDGSHYSQESSHTWSTHQTQLAEERSLISTRSKIKLVGETMAIHSKSTRPTTGPAPSIASSSRTQIEGQFRTDDTRSIRTAGYASPMGPLSITKMERLAPNDDGRSTHTGRSNKTTELRHRKPAPSMATSSPHPRASQKTWKSEGTTVLASTAPERLWPTATQESGGHRTEPPLGRGVLTSAGKDESRWLEVLQIILQYQFQNPDLLEEALESPKSGVTCVGSSHRHFHDGNQGLAKVGEAVMKLVLLDQFYLFKIPESKYSRFDKEGRNADKNRRTK